MVFRERHLFGEPLGDRFFGGPYVVHGGGQGDPDLLDMPPVLRVESLGEAVLKCTVDLPVPAAVLRPHSRGRRRRYLHAIDKTEGGHPRTFRMDRIHNSQRL